MLIIPLMPSIKVKKKIDTGACLPLCYSSFFVFLSDVQMVSPDSVNLLMILLSVDNAIQNFLVKKNCCQTAGIFACSSSESGENSPSLTDPLEEDRCQTKSWYYQLLPINLNLWNVSIRCSWAFHHVPSIFVARVATCCCAVFVWNESHSVLILAFTG